MHRVKTAAIIAALCAWQLGKVRPAAASCAAPAHAIEAENCLPGNPSTEWDISPIAGNSTIEGFATEISYNKGETVRFKVKTSAPSYRMDIYRLGYYGGMGARKVAALTPGAPPAQPACLTNATGLIDCGQWAVAASWTIPAAAISGIYVAKLIRSDNGGASHIVFVVRNDAGTEDILLQTSDTTWQAYNPWGGNSLYIGGPSGTGAYKVSYNRPFTVRGAYPTSVFNHEYPMLRWLEANGYNVAYFTDVDADRRGALIRNHRVYMPVGHAEYWSAAERANVEAARAAGIHLAFFSGVTALWKTRWEASIDGSGTSYRTLVCYKETVRGKIDPMDPPTWTGMWRDKKLSPTSDGGKPENALTGHSYAVDALRNDTMTVPAEYGRMRLWRNTSVASLSPGQTASFPQTLGAEWDEDTDNSVRPPGIIRLSSSTYNVPKHLVGTLYVAGPITHHLTFYRHPSGSRVFSAGTMQWGWGLDSKHNGGTGLPPQPAMQQATVNLLADMNVQPAVLQPGLVRASPSTDAAPPVSRVTFPAAGAYVAPGSVVTIRGTASDSGGAVGGVEISTNNGVSWHPAVGRESWSYAWTVVGTGSAQLISRAADDSGNIETPAAGVGVTRGSAPSGSLFSDVFDGPNKLVTNAYAYLNPASTSAARSASWDVTAGSLFQNGNQGWTGVPDNVAPNATSSNGTGSAAFKLWTKRADLGNVTVAFDLITRTFGTTPTTPAAAWDGVHLLLRQVGSAFYLVSVNRRDNVAVIKKRNSSGVYATLATAPYMTPLNLLQAVAGSVSTNANGSVTVRLDVGGRLIVSATDSGTNGAPLAATGRVGVQGDNADFRLDNFTVRTFAGPAPSAVLVQGPGESRVFPNPWRSDLHKGTPVTFDFPAAGGEVKIFTVSGRWVRTLAAAGTRATWDLANDSGESVASGYYFYLETFDGGKSRGLMAVIR